MNCPNHISSDIWAALPAEIQLEIAQEFQGKDKFIKPAASNVESLIVMVQNNNLFVDTSFSTTSSSIDGRKLIQGNSSSSADKSQLTCLCKVVGRLRQVSKDGPNQGRYYLSCGKGMCKFFEWADSIEVGPSKKQNIQWVRFHNKPTYCLMAAPHYRVIQSNTSNFSTSIMPTSFQSPSLALDIRQGSIGDCWFLSALSVVAERPDLIARILLPMLVTLPLSSSPQPPANSHINDVLSLPSDGKLTFSLFLDGYWRDVCIDDHLPCHLPGSAAEAGRKRGLVHIMDAFQPTPVPVPVPAVPELKDVALMYSKASPYYTLHQDTMTQWNQLWVSYLEKAYAKSMGCYQAIHGGEIGEALLDLTGCPIENISFSHVYFDSEEVWVRLMSFCEVGFPMGASSAGSRGVYPGVEMEESIFDRRIAGYHAYSILDTVEFDVGEVMQEQAEGAGGLSREVQGSMRGYVDHGETRYGPREELVHTRWILLRNPWGVASRGPGSGKAVPRRKPPSTAPSPSLSSSHSRYRYTDILHSLSRPADEQHGTLWISYHDFLLKFDGVDVCKAHDRHMDIHSYVQTAIERQKQLQGTERMHTTSNFPLSVYEDRGAGAGTGAWCQLSLQLYTHPTSYVCRHYYDIHIPTMGAEEGTCWVYFTLLQKTKRGSYASDNALKRRYWYTDVTMVLYRVMKIQEGEEEVQEVGRSAVGLHPSASTATAVIPPSIIGSSVNGCKRSTNALEVHLTPGDYRMVILHFNPRKDPESGILRVYSSRALVHREGGGRAASTSSSTSNSSSATLDSLSSTVGEEEVASITSRQYSTHPSICTPTLPPPAQCAHTEAVFAHLVHTCPSSKRSLLISLPWDAGNPNPTSILPQNQSRDRGKVQVVDLTSDTEAEVEPGIGAVSDITTLSTASMISLYTRPPPSSISGGGGGRITLSMVRLSNSIRVLVLDFPSSQSQSYPESSSQSQGRCRVIMQLQVCGYTISTPYNAPPAVPAPAAPGGGSWRRDYGIASPVPTYTVMGMNNNGSGSSSSRGSNSMGSSGGPAPTLPYFTLHYEGTICPGGNSSTRVIVAICVATALPLIVNPNLNTTSTSVNMNMTDTSLRSISCTDARYEVTYTGDGSNSNTILPPLPGNWNTCIFDIYSV